MWKKSNATDDSPERTDNAAPNPGARASSPASQAAGPRARIGPSLSFKGELSGEEDLLIEGKVEGRVVIKKGSVTVGEKGRLEADVEAASIQVAGSVKGDLTAAERVVLLETGRVEGNIKAKSVTLENGCRFKGSIDMESDGGAARKDPVKSGPVARTGTPPASVRAEV